MKYVMFDVDGIDVPVVFPEVIQHYQVVVNTIWGSKVTPVSAGKITLFAPLRVEAHGESISLELKSRPEDSAILTKYFEDF
ncbi:hypothetical protein LCGC14_1567810 [marine sediment metagenome]|uniref:Uncharacterized protein n=1 Tax=marine sediment metagenome TaxID=412755 RepID=A0A0F9J6U1_9ZZZZ